MTSSIERPVLKRRPRGHGWLFWQPNSPSIWFGYYLHGEERYANTQTTDEAKAHKFGDKIIKHKNADDIGAMTFQPSAGRVTVNEILDDYLATYRLGGKKRIPRQPDAAMMTHLNTVRECFGQERALSIGSRQLQAFIAQRLAEGYAKAAINRPLQQLRAAYRIATKGNPPKLPRMPEIVLLDESDNVRKGKITPQEAELLFASLPAWLVDFARFEYETASRPKEIRQLRWNWVTAVSIEVPAAITKNRSPRSIALTPELRDIFARRRLAHVPGCDLIFHRDGQPIGDYRAAWYSACVLNGLGAYYCRRCQDADGSLNSRLDAKLKCPRCGQHYSHKTPKPKYIGKLFYDFKRSGCHEMRQAGSSVEDCMRVSGHLTPNMFLRYADLFSADEDRAIQLQVQERRHQWREAQPSQPNLITMPKRAAIQ